MGKGKEKNKAEGVRDNPVKLFQDQDIYVEYDEHPQHYNGRDITKEGKFTKDNVTDEEA